LLAANPARGRIRSVERAAAILRLLSGRSRRMGVAELARELGLPKATVHGILRTLHVHGFVEQDTDSLRYQLGAALLPMGLGYLEANSLRIAALNGTYALASRTGESAVVGTLYGQHVLIVHQVSRSHTGPQTLDLGRLVPAHATALGKALLTQRRDLLANLAPHGLGRFTQSTCTDIAALQRDVEEISTEAGALRSKSCHLASPRSPHRSRQLAP